MALKNIILCQKLECFRGLIQELADYEKMPDGPKINAETLEKDGFGATKFFHCIVAEVDNKVSFKSLF